MASSKAVLAAVLFCLAESVAGSPLANVASSFVGASSSDVFPPPSPTNTDAALFPGESAIGNAGPTPTGIEPYLVATAPALPILDNVYPLVDEYASDSKTLDIYKKWGNLSPMFSVPDGTHGVSANAEVPEGCTLDQVHLVHRHGARYPTSTGGTAKFASRMHNASATGKLSFSGSLSFMNTWAYPLGAEVLTPFGRSQLFMLGVNFRQKYGHLLNKFTNALPVFRTTSEDRMYKSAINFAAGFFGLPYEDKYQQSIIIEESGYNNSLASYYVCNNSNVETIGYAGDAVVTNFTNIFLAAATKRLQANVKGYTLTTADAYAMMQLCSYESVALGYSKFCGLFTQQEFEDYAYSYDLSFWYSSSFGNPTAAAIGVGYVTELLAILAQEHTPVYNTSVNGTLAGSDVTNPLNQSIYVSATHDTVISAIVVALNFTSLAAGGPLPTLKRPAKQSFHTEQISPFASRMTGQVLSCGKKGKQFRWTLNDASVPLDGLHGCPKDPKYGMCPLDTYIAGLRKRNQEIDFNYVCNGNYTYNIPKGGGGVTNGLPPPQHRA